MVKIYVKNADGQKVYVEVTDEQAKEYRDECRREWRNMANEKNHTVSLDEIVDAGHDMADEKSDIESIFEEKERKANTKTLIGKLKEAMLELTPTVYNLATVKEWIKKKRLRYEKHGGTTGQLYGYDEERYGIIYRDGLKENYLFNILETYAQAYFIYVLQSSLIVSN